MNHVENNTNLPPIPAAATPLAYWVYISIASQPFSEAELSTLLQKSRASNENRGLTGMLLYKEGNFMQMLEGPEDIVQTMSEKIRRDARHDSLVSLVHKNQTQRLFPESWMGFATADAISPAQRAQIDSILQAARVAPEDMDKTTGTHPARTLMQTFAHYL